MEISKRLGLMFSPLFMNNSGISYQEFSLGHFSILYLAYPLILLTHKNYGYERNLEGYCFSDLQRSIHALAANLANKDKMSWSCCCYCC